MRRWALLLCLSAVLWPAQILAQTAADPLTNPRTAVLRALLERGINPAYDRRPYVQNMLRRAEEIVFLVMIGNPDVLLDGDRYQQAINEFVGEASSGGRLFGGWSVADLGALADRAAAAEPATDPAGVALAWRLRDDTVSVGVVRAAIGGGMSRSMAENLEMIATVGCVEYRYTVQVERPGAYDNCLQYLTRERLRGW